MQFVRRLLGEQRKRAVASVMSVIEANCQHLTAQQQREVRAKVLAALNQYHDTTLDILKSSVDDGTQVNEEALRQLAEFNRHLREQL